MSKPKLVKVGRHFINPADVSGIREVTTRNGTRMYIVDRISCPSPSFALWVEKEDISLLLHEFDLVVEG